MNFRLASQYIKELSGKDIVVDNDFFVEGISYSSKSVTKNSLFVIKGENFKLIYFYDAIVKGARIIVLTKEFILNNNLNKNESFLKFFNSNSFIFIVVDDIREAMIKIVNLYYNNVYKNIKLIGITGTKGKTTTAYYLFNVLKNNKIKVGLLSSEQNYNGKTFTDSDLTTPEIFELHKFLYECYENNLEYVILEVSSQALKYKRVGGLLFKVGIFLNISNDHISDIEHPNFADYLQSKLLLSLVSENFIINEDCIEGGKLLRKNPSGAKIKSFLKKNKISYKINKPSDRLTLALKGFPEYNIKNASLATAAIKMLGLDINSSEIFPHILSTKINGRNEVIEFNDKTILVDYAHNGLSFTEVFNYSKTFNKKETVVVFGATGTKGQNRRTDIAKAVAKFNPDKIYLTEDDPGDEDVIDILGELFDLLLRNKLSLKNKIEIEQDRKKAIYDAINNSKESSIILILGKGNDAYMVRKGQKEEYEGDIKVVKSVIARVKRNASKKAKEIKEEEKFKNKILKDKVEKSNDVKNDAKKIETEPSKKGFFARIIRKEIHNAPKTDTAKSTKKVAPKSTKKVKSESSKKIDKSSNKNSTQKNKETKSIK